MSGVRAPAKAPGRPSLHVDADTPGLNGVGVTLRGLCPDQMVALRRQEAGGDRFHAVLTVSVVQPASRAHDDLPGIAGHYALLEDGLRFQPAFPFERRTRYKARFLARALTGAPGCHGRCENQGVEFSFGAGPSLPEPCVRAIFPSGSDLPANLLRFTVTFSNPMQRGLAKTNIALLDADGRPVPDVLYNAPVELWDSAMRCLTVLLDPGRLKRGVGPNRALGPPLDLGRHYALVVRARMADALGAVLPRPVRKHFRVVDAVRTPISTDQWRLTRVAAGTHEPLVAMFPRALDWALLSNAITVETSDGGRIHGCAAIDRCETCWGLTPASPWVAGSYRLRVAPWLEDTCGNTQYAPFDRPLRSEQEMSQAEVPSFIPFRVA